MSKDGSLVCVRIAALAMLGLFGIAGPAAPAAAEPKSPTGGAQLCKEKCEKDCMGNDTPTERSNCLQREKCGDRAACPKEAPPPKRVDPGTGGTTKPPKTYQMPKANTEGVCSSDGLVVRRNASRRARAAPACLDKAGPAMRCSAAFQAPSAL